jgi:hypothetical protein
MSDNKELYDPVDRFSKYFRQRLKIYPTPPDEHCWDEIEMRLQKKHRLSQLWYGVSIAASVLVAVFVFNYFPDKNEQDIKENSAYHKESSLEYVVTETDKPEEKDFAMDKEDVTAIGQQTIRSHRILATGKATGKQLSVFIDEVSMAPDSNDEEDVVIREAPVEAEDARQDTNEKKEPDEVQKTGPEKPYRTFENMTAYNIRDKNERNKNQGWQISAGFGSVGGFPSFDLNSADDVVNDPSLSPDPGYVNGGNPGSGGEKPEEKIMNIKPAMPFSVGIMVRRKLNGTLGIETGLIYSRLSSDLTVGNNKYCYDASLILHYLGVPVSLTVDLWEKNRLSLYATGGGMVEKGLRSVYKQKTPLWNSLMKKDEINRISGLQWSLHGGIGISYNFYKEMNLYIEPGISYYFDCNQPVSRRTEDPLSFSLRLGVRYDF